MNLKSYTRGIGAGFIVAALVLGFGNNKTEKMTDAQIKARAMELGMIEAQTLTQYTTEEIAEKVDNKDNTGNKENAGNEVKNETSASVSADSAPEFKEPDEVTVDPILPSTDENEKKDEGESEDKKPEENKTGDNKPETQTSEDVTPPQIDPLPDDETGYVQGNENVEIQIVRGDSSVTVARRLFEAGLVESAVEFDKFLCQNGYDKIISVGTYTIPYGSTFEEMAKIITRR